MFNRPVTAATAKVSGRPEVRVPIGERRPGRWPSEIRFDDLPTSGVDVTVVVPHRAGLRVAVVDETPALTGIPGFSPRPPGLDRSARSDSDIVFVGRIQRL